MYVGDIVGLLVPLGVKTDKNGVCPRAQKAARIPQMLLKKAGAVSSEEARGNAAG